MSVELNHTIVHARDKQASAEFLTGLLGLGPPESTGHFVAVQLSNGVTLDYDGTDGDVTSQHYAFCVSEEEFDAIFGRIKDRGVAYYADPGHHQAGEINNRQGGRGLYFEDPDGHNLEILTRA